MVLPFLEWAITELRSSDAAHVQLAAQALSPLLSRDDYVGLFFQVRLVEPLSHRLPSWFIKSFLSPMISSITRLFSSLQVIRPHHQATYYVLYCLWVLTYHGDFVRALAGSQVVAVMHDYLRTSKKEKLIRLALFVFQNISKEYQFLSDMISLGVIVTLEKLERRSFSDPDIKALIEPLKTLLEHDHVFLRLFVDFFYLSLPLSLSLSHTLIDSSFVATAPSTIIGKKY